MENDLTNINCNKSKCNRITQFLPESIRAKTFRIFNVMNWVPLKVLKSKESDKYYVVFLSSLGNTHVEVFTADEDGDNYWDSLSHEEVYEAVNLPIIPN